MKHFLHASYVLACLAVVGTSTAASAEAVLKISTGDNLIEMNNGMMDALPQVSFETSTIWTEGVISFSGPSLRSLVDQAGITGGQLTLAAINDYEIQISYDELENDAPIIATLMNGQPLSRREKGPLWLVYPYDTDIKYQSEVIYAKSIWQLVTIEHSAAK